MDEQTLGPKSILRTIAEPAETLPIAASAENASSSGSFRWQRIGRLKTEYLAIVYLVAITQAEVITALIHPMWGVLAHVVILGLLLVHATNARSEWERTFYLSLVIAPIIRIISLGMPLGQFDQQWWYALSSIPLFAACLAFVRTMPFSRRELYLQFPRVTHWPVTILVICSGLVLGYIEYLILRPEPITSSLHWTVIIIPSLILLVGTGVIEELIFRGILQRTAAEIFGTWPGILFVSALFGVLHIGHLSLFDVFFVSAVALYFAVVVRWTRSLFGVSVAHGLTNITLFIVFPHL